MVSTKAFDAGNFPERLCEPMAEEIRASGGEVRTDARLAEIVLDEDDTVKHYRMQDGSIVEGDLYLSAMPGKSSTLSQPVRPSSCLRPIFLHLLQSYGRDHYSWATKHW